MDKRLKYTPKMRLFIFLHEYHYNIYKIAEIASQYHDRPVMSGISGIDLECKCCGSNKEYSLTSIEHDSKDYSKDLLVCCGCYSAIVNWWEKHKPHKIAPI